MTNLSEEVPLRVSHYDLNNALKSDPQYDELMKLKNLQFVSPDALINKVSDLLSFVKKDYLSWEEKEFIILSSSSFVYLFQKFDTIYQQKYTELLNSNNPEEDYSNKQLLSRLFQCEQTTHVFLPWEGEEVVNDLVSLLEVLYDDHEHLDALLFLLNYKESDSAFIAGPANSKALHFIAPFLKILYGSETDLLSYWKNGSENERLSLRKKVFEEIENLLRNHTDMSNEEIESVCKEIQEEKGDLESKRINLRRISRRKDQFAQETKYYEALGTLSLIYHLWCLEEESPKVSMAFLRIGLVTFLYSMKEWDYKQTGNSSYKVQFYTALANLNLEFKPELPSEVLVYLLNECGENIYKEEYLQMLELNACVLQHFIISMERRGINAHFLPKIVQYADSLLMKKMNEDFVWSEFLKFIKKNFDKFSEVRSKYIGTNCLQETLTYTWILFLEKIMNANFLSVSEKGKYSIDSKYFSNIWNSLEQISHFMTKDKVQFALLPSYLQSKIIVASGSYLKYQNLIPKVDLSDIYHVAEEEMIQFMGSDSDQDLSAGSHIFFALQNWSTSIADNGKNAEKVGNFIKDIFAKSELIEKMRSFYQEGNNILLSRKIKNSASAESFARFAIFILANIKNDSSFLHESKNIEFTKCLIQDALSIETGLLSGRTIDALSCTLETLYSETDILKKFDEYKLFFMFVRNYMNKPCLDEWEDEDFWEGVIRNLRNDERNSELLVDLFEEFLDIFEKKLKNPSFNLEKALREFEGKMKANVDVDEKKNLISLEKNGKGMILGGDVTFESLQKTSMVICRRLLPLIHNFTKSFEEEFVRYPNRLKGMIKKIISFGFSPICMFGTEAVFLRNIKSTGGYILDEHERYFSPFLEGVLTGVIDLCEEFKLNEESTMKKINIQRICEMLLSTQARKFVVRAENIPQDIFWEEAALVSLIQAQYIFIDTLNNDDEPPFNLSPEVKDLLERGIKLSIKTWKNFYKCVAEYFAEESVQSEKDRLDILSRRYKSFIEKDFKFVKNLTYILDWLNKEDDYKEEVKKLHEEILEDIFFVGEDTEKRTRLIYNSFVLHEIASIDEGKEFIKKFLLKEENFERVLDMIIDLLSFYAKFENSFSLEFYSDYIADLVEIIQILDLDEEDDEDDEDPQANHKISVLFLEKIVNFIGKLNSLGLMEKRSEKLNEQMSTIFECFQDIYDFYIKLQTNEAEVESAGNKSNSEEENERLDVVSKEEIQEEEKSNKEEEREGDHLKEEKVREDGERLDPKKEEVEKEKKKLIEQDKEEIKKFAKVLIVSEFLGSDNIKWFLDLEDTCRILSKELWLGAYEKLYKKNIELILEILSKEKGALDLQSLLQEEIKDTENKLTSILGENITNQSIKQLVQMNWIFKRQKIFFTEKLADNLKLSQNFVEGMTWAVERILGGILISDLTEFKSEMRNLDMPQIFNELSTNVGQFLLGYIVASVSNENYSSQNEDFRKLMLKIYDLVDRYFEVHQYFIEQVKWDILSEDCFEILMNCLTVALKLNKDLRVNFLNRDSLSKLLTTKKLCKLSEKQLRAISFLTSILLEESLVFESDLELTMKEIAFKQKEIDQLGLEDLRNLESFIPFKFYKRTMEFLKASLVGKSIDLSNFKGKAMVKDYQNGDDVPVISYLRKAISPVAKKTIQTVFKALIENYGFEENSKDLRIKYYQNKEQQQKEKDDRDLQRREPLELYLDPKEQDKPVLKEDFYYKANLKTDKLLVKDTSALIILVSSIMQNTPHLIPYMVFQKVDMDEILQVFKDDESIRKILDNKGKNWTMLDVLFRLSLYRDAGAVLYLIGGLINAEFLMNTTTLSGEKLGDLVINKIYEIFQDILTRENLLGEAYKSLESVQMRKNITVCLLYLSEKVKKLPYLSEKKYEIMQLNLALIPSFLQNYSLLAEVTENGDLNSWIIPDIANLIESNLKTEGSENNILKKFSSNLTGLFEEHIFNVGKEEIDREVQKLYEIWDEKEQWDNEEAKSILSYASVWKSSPSCRDFIRLPINLKQDALTEDKTLDNFFWEFFDRLDNLVYLYKVSEFDGSEKSKLRNLELDYRQDRHQEDCEFMITLKSKNETKSFCKKDAEEEFKNLPGILRPSTEKAENLEKQKNIFEDYLLSIEEDEDKKGNEGEDEEDDKEEKEKSESNDNDNEEKVDKSKENLEIDYKYFVDKSVKNESNFRFKVNQALKKSKRVKEIICLEKKFGELLNVLKKTDDFEEILEQFTRNLSEFEKSVVYAGLGREITLLLSHETQEKIKNVQDELKLIKEDYDLFDEKLQGMREKDQGEKKDEQEVEKNVSEDNNQNDDDSEDDEDEKEEKEESEDECDSEYDELDYDFEFLIKEDKKEDHHDEDNESQSENSNSMEEEDSKDIHRTVDLFRADDSLILEASKLFFSHFVIHRNGVNAMIQLFGEALSLNPANEIKIFDTLLFILYSPECLEPDFKSEEVDFPPRYPIPRNSEYDPVQVYEATAQNIIAWLCAYSQNAKRSDIFFLSKENLDKSGNQILKNLKEKTGFANKISECSSILDMIIGLFVTKPFSRNREWIEQILTQIQTLLKNKKDAVLSKRAVLTLLNLAKDPIDTPTNRAILKNIREIFLAFKDYPKSVLKYLTSCMEHLNKETGNLKGDLKVIEIIFSFLVFQNQGLAEGINDFLFKNEETKTFILNLYEILEKNVEEEEDSIVLIIFYHFSLVLMMEKYEKTPSQNDISNTEKSLPSLARLVSFEETKPIQRSFSSLRKEQDVDFRAIFTNFAWKHSAAISKFNHSLAKNLNPSLTNAMSVIIPQVLWVIDFETKLALLENHIRKKMKEAGVKNYDTREITVDRNSIVHSAMKNFKECDKKTLLEKLELTFKNEEGVDGGGLTREFFALIAKELFGPLNGLFKVSDNHRTIQPSPFSNIIPNDLKYLEFAGIILGKAIVDKIALDVSFTKPFLKHILGKEINIRELEDIDADLSKNLDWILTNPVEDLHLAFTHETEFLGERLNFELKEGGSEIQVNEENKKEYVKRVCEFRMTNQIEKQIQAFLKGFYSIIPKSSISHLAAADLEIVISGAAKIDLQEMKKYANYRDYSEGVSVITWLWEILAEFDQEKLATFYYYLSGSVKVPVGGFKQHPIKIRRTVNKDGLPVAHTCSYELDLPEYENKEKLREKLLKAIFDGAEGFYIS